MDQLVVIVVLACNNLMADPANGKKIRCEEFPLTFIENVTNMQCMLHSQVEIAKHWWPTHQDWDVRRITCKRIDKTATNSKEDI